MRVFHNYNAYTSHKRHCTDMTKDKQLFVSHKDDNIDPYFSNDPNVKYLTYTDQMDKFKPTEYYIVNDFETMEEFLNNNNENIIIDREDDDSSSSS
jgi:glycerophosphoryl diester phosphodiesterase